MTEMRRVPKMDPQSPRLQRGSIKTEQMFEKLNGLFRRFIDFEDPLFNRLSVIYVVLTYFYDIFDEIPYLQVFGQKASGKTRLGNLFEGLCFNSFNSSDISDASHYRAISQQPGGVTMIIDEAEDLSSSKRRGLLLRILRSGYRRNGNTTRCSPNGGIKRFSTFGPRIIINECGIEDSALDSRTIPIHMIKSTRSLDKFRFSQVEKELKEARDLLRSFTREYREFVSDRYALFEGVGGVCGRDEEIWTPIFVIAEVLDAELDEPCMKPAMVTLARKTILYRQKMQLIGNREAQILEGTQAFTEEVEPLEINGKRLYVGQDLARFISDRWDLTGLKIETVSRTLERNALIVGGPRRLRLPNKGQKTCYALDREKLVKITAEYFDGIQANL